MAVNNEKGKVPYTVQMALLAKSSALTTLDQEKLLAFKNKTVLIILANNPRISKATQQTLLQSSSVGIRWSLSQNQNLAFSIQKALVLDKSLDVLKEVLKNSTIKLQLRKEVAGLLKEQQVLPQSSVLVLSKSAEMGRKTAQSRRGSSIS